MRLGLLRGPTLVNEATVGAVMLGCIALAVEAARILVGDGARLLVRLGIPASTPPKA